MTSRIPWWPRGLALCESVISMIWMCTNWLMHQFMVHLVLSQFVLDASIQELGIDVLALGVQDLVVVGYRTSPDHLHHIVLVGKSVGI